MSTLYNITDIQAALGFKVTAEFIIETLGVPAHSSDKRARFFTAEQYDLIKKKLSKHCLDSTLQKTAKKAAAPAKKAAAPVDDDDDL